MRLIPRSLKWRALLIAVAVTASSLTVTYLLNRNAVDGWASDVRRWYAEQRELRDRIDKMKTCDDPVLRDLARGEFRRGASVDEWLAKHPSAQCYRHDNYVTVVYGRLGLIGPHVVAEDGRLVHAGCGAFTFITEFFTFCSEADRRRWVDSFDRRCKNEHAAQAAVLGVGPLARMGAIRFGTVLTERDVEPPGTGYHIRSPGPRPRDLSRPARVARGAAALTR